MNPMVLDQSTERTDVDFNTFVYLPEVTTLLITPSVKSIRPTHQTSPSFGVRNGRNHALTLSRQRELASSIPSQ
jgi:hypothetical protein